MLQCSFHLSETVRILSLLNRHNTQTEVSICIHTQKSQKNTCVEKIYFLYEHMHNYLHLHVLTSTFVYKIHPV